MADNTTLNLGSGGDVIRTVDRTTAKAQIVGLDFGGDTGAGNEQIVTTSNPFPTASTGSYFVLSSANSSTAQLAAGASFVGTMEALPIALDLSLNIVSDQPFSVVINFYANSSAGSLIDSSEPVQGYLLSNGKYGLNISAITNGNYGNIVLTNNGRVATTALVINAQYGAIPTSDQAGNQPMAIYGTDDLEGVNLIEAAIRGDVAISTRPINLPQTDVNNALIISDAPTPNRLVASTVGQTYIIDTQGYPTISITMGTMAGTLTGTNDLSGAWLSIAAMNPTATSTTSSLSASTTYVIPCVTRYIRLVVTTAGWATYFARSQPSGLQSLAQTPINLVGYNGATVAYTNPVFASLVALASTNGQTLGGIIVSSTTPAATVIKATAGRLTMLDLYNASTSAAFFHLYNAASVTLGTTASIQSFGVPAAGHRSVILPDGGLYFSTGICGAWTNLAATTDNTTLTASGQTTNYAYI